MGWNDSNNNDDGKDPWSGGKKPTPPDLEEALKKLQQRMAAFLKSGGDGSSTPPDANNSSFGFGVIASIIFGLWFIAGFYIVEPAEEAVILRFGKYIKTVGSGPHWIPRLINQKYIVDIQNIYHYNYSAEMLNKDGNIVSVAVSVQYRIANPNQFLFNVVNPDQSLQQATASALRQVVGHTTLDEVLTTGREVVRSEVESQLKSILGLYQTGLEVTDVALQSAKAPEEVKSAFDDAIKALEDERRYKNQAEAYAAKVEPIAKGQASRILQEAEAYREQVILRAKGEVAGFMAILPEYRKAPEVTRQRMYLSAIEDILQRSTKVLFDIKGSQQLTYLPLEKIIPSAVTSAVKQGQGNTDTSDAAVSEGTGFIRPENESMSTVMPSDRTMSMRLDRSAYQGRGEQ